MTKPLYTASYLDMFNGASSGIRLVFQIRYAASLAFLTVRRRHRRPIGDFCVFSFEQLCLGIPNGTQLLNQFVLAERKYWRRRKDTVIRLKFPVKPAEQKVDVDNAELRLLAPPLPGQETVRVKILQVLGAHRRRMLQEREIYLSPTLNKWFEFDVTEAVRSWLDGERNLGLELECTDCGFKWRPLEAAISALIHPEPSRFRRSAFGSYDNPNRRTDCTGRPSDKQKRSKCCRHMMTVTFKDLDLPNMEFIVQPKSYEAGFCRGRCPLNYNHATNHSRIQSLVHRHNKTMPKVCCTPSKLEPLEILRINPHDTQKLKIEKWDNMRVLECACS